MKGTCEICGFYRELEKHHIFGGPNRKLSEKYKLTMKLCASCHRTGDQAAHNDAAVSRKLKEYGQRKFEKEHPDLNFLDIFGRNYLDGKEHDHEDP